MIELTVKTLDSQNHQFTVEDDITVEQFKSHIADTVNIPADTQRIIFRGRVLQDSSKLSEYDVHGKVVHLVQRAPPSQTPQSNSRSSSPQPQQRRVYRPYRMEQGNAMYLGSMAFPGNLMEQQGIVPPPPTHSLSGSRLNVARRMLRRAEAVIQQLENPTTRPQEQQSNEETQEDEEVTPIIEARVIVPTNSEPIDDVLNAVQNTLINATAGAMAMNIDAATLANAARAGSNGNSGSGSGSAQRSPNQSGTSTPGGPTPRSSSTENLTSDQRSDNNGGLPENALRTTEMADLLTFMGQLQTRFAPFLANYHNFMVQDPEIPPDQVRSTQLMLNRVSEVMHFFSHAYHSLSDIIVRVRTPPSRPLLCRPILIQHSAVVQTGIPIQVEAQINLSADRPPFQTIPQSQTAQNGAVAADGTPSAPAEPGTNPPAANPNPTLSVQSGFVGLPFLPGTVRVQSIPVEIRTLRAAPSTPRSQNNNNNTVNAPSTNQNSQNNAQSSQPTAPPTQAGTPPSQSGAPSTQMGTPPRENQPTPIFTELGAFGISASMPPPAAPPAAADSRPSAPQEGTTGPQQTPGGGPTTYNFNNPNVEFFMEVTPEGITIDSLETTLVGSNQANDLLRGALNGPTPEFLQSIMRMAGQIINQNIATTSAQPQSTSTPPASDSPADQPSAQSANAAQASSSASTTTGASAAAAAAAAAASGQNSQARGNTQTNPTTATSTRSTPRPHVHLAHQAMNGGFDPFLPCNSHHISRRRLQMSSGTSQRSSQQNTSSNSSSQRQSQSQSQRQQQSVPTAASAPSADSAQRSAADLPDLRNFIHFINRRANRPGEQPNQAGEGSQGSASMAGDSLRAERQQMMPQQLLQFFSRLSTTTGNMPDILNSRNLTLEQMLQQFQQDDQYVAGENIFVDLIMIFVRNLTLMDLFTLNSGNTEPINRNISAIQNFVRTRICEGNTTPTGVARGTERLITELQPFLQNFSSLPARDDISMVRSAEQLFRIRLPEIITTAINLSPENVRQLFDMCVNTAKQLLALSLYISVTGQQGVEQTYEQLMNRFMQDVSPDLHNWTMRTSRFQLRQVMSNLNIPENDLLPYITLTSDPVVHSHQTIVANGFIPPPDEAMELDPVGPQINVLDVPAPAVMLEDPEPLPNVILGSEPWHGQVPEDWVPIITRDSQKQRRQNGQGPFSDAYLSGMPSKKRKLVNNSKPQGSLPQVITDSVRQAVTATGLATVAPLETVAQSAGASSEVQTAYRNLLRTTVQTNLRDNEDFLPERFPNVSNYFNGNHQP